MGSGLARLTSDRHGPGVVMRKPSSPYKNEEFVRRAPDRSLGMDHRPRVCKVAQSPGDPGGTEAPE